MTIAESKYSVNIIYKDGEEMRLSNVDQYDLFASQIILKWNRQKDNKIDKVKVIMLSNVSTVDINRELME